MSTAWIWLGFIVLIGLLLALDLGVLHRRDEGRLSTEVALLWTGFWIVLALAFGAFVYFAYEGHWLGIGESIGHEVDGETAIVHYYTAYLVEKSLSLDNIFVMALVFGYFRVPDDAQHRVLFLGIAGAVVLRGVLIVFGLELIAQFDWLTYVLGALLVLTAWRMLRDGGGEIDIDNSRVLGLVRRVVPVTDQYDGERFFTRIDGRLVATPLLLALVTIETTDLVFAIDSIPACFAVTRDPFIVFSSNIFAILGLRALYFALAGVLTRFPYLESALVVVLAFVGVKMLLVHHVPVPSTLSLGVIFGALATGIGASLTMPPPGEGGAPRRRHRKVWRLYIVVSTAIVMIFATANALLPDWRVALLLGGTGLVLACLFVARRSTQKIVDEAGEDAGT